jgi:soluble lytic murein transglycosylase-like protein
MDRVPSRTPTPLGALALLLGVMLVASAHYVIQPGDTLSGIAARTGLSIADLQAANGIADPHRIYAGHTLELPEPSAVAPGADQASSSPATGARADIGALLESVSRQYGMSPAFVKAVAWQESGWNPGAVSSANAVGVMQVLPSTGEWVSQSLVGRDLDLTNPADNIEAGVVFLRYLYRITGGDVDRTLAGYYQGLRSVSENGMYTDTVRYIANVRALRERF